jgi:hypothetical protein
VSDRPGDAGDGNRDDKKIDNLLEERLHGRLGCGPASRG